jgi:hypothetical protein
LKNEKIRNPIVAPSTSFAPWDSLEISILRTFLPRGPTGHSSLSSPGGTDTRVAPLSGLSGRRVFGVSEIWDAREQFEAFGQRLMPITSGVELAGPPEVIEVHNVIRR